MTGVERKALEAVNRRVDQMASTARIFAYDTNNSADMSDALQGLADTLTFLSDELDALVGPSSQEAASDGR